MGCFASIALNGNAIAPKISDIEGEVGKWEKVRMEYNQKEPTKENLKLFLAQMSQKYGGNYYELYKVIECESNFVWNAIGDNGKAVSVAQYHKPTFNQFCKGNYYNPYDQLECFARMVKEKLGHHWTCFRRLNN